MLIDSHCHLPSLKSEKSAAALEKTLQEATSVGVTRFIDIGPSLSHGKRAMAVADKYPSVYAVVGVYPNDELSKTPVQLKPDLEKLLTSSKKVVGIGECGIDITNWSNQRPLEQQLELFGMQIQLALKYHLPVVIHNRNGDAQVLQLLQKYSSQGLTGVAHSFTQDWEYAQRMLDHGLMISLSLFLLGDRYPHLAEVAQKVPMDRLILETDSPYQQYQGQPGHPKYVRIVAEKIAQVKQKPFEEVAEAAYENTCALFNLPPEDVL